MFWSDGQLVWDDYLEHRQYALADGVERALRWFTDFRDVDSVENLEPGRDWRQVAAALVKRNILVTEDSPRHRQEESVTASWSAWGPMAQAFHFSTRSLARTAMRTIEQDGTRLEAKKHTDPPPPAFMTVPHTTRIALPPVDPTVWQHRDLIDVLHRRRSNRVFSNQPLPLATASALLHTAAGPLRRVPGRVTPECGPVMAPGGILADDLQQVFKTSPSGGARHPTEIYLYARNVAGLEPGAYHYAAADHALEQLGRSLDDEQLVAAVGDQAWVGGAAALIFYTSVIARSQWKYNFPRNYRALMMDIGHLSQTVYLLATAADLHVTYTAALRDETVEELLGCDPVRQLVIGTSVIGMPDRACPAPA
ncbi:SagB family peptide dehydrogenase [Streptomyces sp. NPDC020490]|uniref:SagB family peptide dehydrogenase n=1 Tax=Streptomyces sp. NPDC020490 TaxID=3365078 RepID=UPI00378B4208